jgi:hypothetical protein
MDILSVEDIKGLCDELSNASKLMSGRRTSPALEDFYGRGLRAFCRRLAADWRLMELAEVCEELENHLPGNCDSFYYRSVLEFIETERRKRSGEPIDVERRLNELLMRAVEYRRGTPEVLDEALHTSGTHLDALILALLETLGRTAEAERYRSTIKEVWSDGLFVNNRPSW